MDGTDVSGSIDEESHFKLIRKETCADHDRHVFDLSYAGGAIEFGGTTRAWSVLESAETRHDLRPNSSETTPKVESWSVQRPSSVEFTGGTIGATRDASGQVVGDVDLKFGDDSVVTCTFELPFERSRAEGTYPDCGDGDGDDDDFDD